MDNETFRCEAFKGVTMPADKQRGFCAIQFRKGREVCVNCERGKAAAKETLEEARGNLEGEKAGRSEGKKLNVESSILNSGDSRREAGMAVKKLCSCGCGKGAVKDGLATKCYRKKHGVGPFEKPAKGQAGRQSKISRGKRTRSTAGKHDHECEGCKVLQLQLDELNRAESVMVAAGLCTADKFEAARKIVRELHA